MTPAEVLENLCGGVHPKRQHSLRLIHAVCERQRALGSVDFSLKVIGRLCQTEGGPAERALRNPAGALYRQLIECHAAAAGAPRPSKPSTAAEDGLLDGVRDPAQRARIELLRDELKSVRRKLQVAQKVANATATVTLIPSSEGGAGIPAARIGQHTAVSLRPIEQQALSAALEPRRLKSAGLKIDDRGRILHADGRVAFPIGFATAVAKIAAELGTPSEKVPVDFTGDGFAGDVTGASSGFA